MSQEKGSQSNVNGQQRTELPEPEVVPTAQRRQFSAAYKKRMLAEADKCTEPGQVGALLRREGLYSSYLTSWRRQQEQSQLQGLEGKKRGRKGATAQEQELAQLRKENKQLRAQLARAETIIDVQKKLSQLFGLPTAEMKQDEAK